MSKLRLLALLCVADVALFGIMACRATRPMQSTTDAETLVGLLPCADCAGIATTLTLEPDGGYRLAQRYLGRSAEPETSAGTYARASGVLRLAPKPAPGTPTPTQFRVDGSELVQLDLAGGAITGALAERYRLRPADLTLAEGERLLWVDQARVPCTGVGRQTCLRVIRGPGRGSPLVAEDADWTLLYQNIAGYTFVPGQVAQLVVRETHRDAGQTPADASTVTYALVRELARFGDARVRLHDIWALERLGGNDYAAEDGAEHPVVELDLQTMVAMGTDGCNRFRGPIAALGSDTLRFGPLAGTRKMCPPTVMRVADPFNRALAATRTYRLDDLRLRLFGAGGEEVAVLRKVD